MLHDIYDIVALKNVVLIGYISTRKVELVCISPLKEKVAIKPMIFPDSAHYILARLIVG
jgi:hypothetical protein